MSKLFEFYVYSLLRETYGTSIVYQLKDGERPTHGTYGYVDFLKTDEKLIIDTKYKLIYNDNEKYRYEIKDIRQLSGYARDEGVLKKLEIFKEDNETVDEEKVVNCVIIYPNDEKSDNFENRNLIESCDKIEGFTKFYKRGIRLPKKY